MRTLLTASAAALAASSLAFAGDGDFTFNFGYTQLDISEPGVDVGLGAVTFRGGYEFTDYLGFEGQLDIGVSDDTVVVLATPVDLELTYAASLFGIARAPVTENINLFARLGYTTTEIEASVPGVAVSADGDGWGYGVGAEVFFDDRNGLRVDYTRFDIDSTDADTFGIAYVRRFGGGR